MVAHQYKFYSCPAILIWEEKWDKKTSSFDEVRKMRKRRLARLLKHKNNFAPTTYKGGYYGFFIRSNTDF